MDETKSKRRWSRFSLRTLFVLVTIVGVGAGWVAYQLNWMRQRHTFLAQHPGCEPSSPMSPFRSKSGNPSNAPWSLRLLGETPRMFLAVPDGDAAQARQLFPEAVVNWE
jgi:hypothetical protein